MADFPHLEIELDAYSRDAKPLAHGALLGRLTIGRALPDGMYAGAPGYHGQWAMARWAPARERMVATASTHYRSISGLSATLVDPVTSQVETFQLVPPDFDATLKTYLVPFLLGALAARRMLILHAAGIHLDGVGLLVTGPSGAGKSTAAALLGGHVLSDDIVVVGGLPDHPWIDATLLGRVSHGPARSPLGALFFPRKASAFSTEPVAPRVALARFLREHSPYLGRVTPLLRPAAFRLLSDLFAVTPAFELSFCRSEIDRDLVRNALRAPASPPTPS